MKSTDERSKRAILIFIAYSVTILLAAIFTTLMLYLPYPLYRLPHANFIYSPTRPIVYENVTFDASSSYDLDGWIVSYRWDFEDGTIILGDKSIVEHVFSEFGTRKVTLIVTDNNNLTDDVSAIVTVRKPPIARFAYSPIIVYVGDEVVFDATASSGEGGYIVSYEWDFGDGRATTTTEPFVMHVYARSGTHKVVLTVTDSEELYDMKSKILTVVKGAVADVYTQYPSPFGGQGLSNPSDGFAPQDYVTLYANVTFNKTPVKDIFVAFEVHDPSGTIFICETAVTNSVGVATVTFGVPWYSEVIEAIFGTWFVYASAEVLGEKVNDTLTFPVGWLVELVKLETCDYEGNAKTSFLKGENVYFKVHLSNIALVRKNVTVTITIHDELNVPINSSVLDYFILPPRSYTIFITDMQIPKWAFVGKATAYANAFTKLPTEGGIAYCPETSDIFVIAGIH